MLATIWLPSDEKAGVDLHGLSVIASPIGLSVQAFHKRKEGFFPERVTRIVPLRSGANIALVAVLFVPASSKGWGRRNSVLQTRSFPSLETAAINRPSAENVTPERK